MTVTNTQELVALHGLTAAPEGPLVPREKLVEFARALREELGFAFLTYITASHHLAVPSKTKGDVVEPAIPAYYMVAYRVRNLEKNWDFPFRCRVDLGTTVPSLCALWAGADWQERECFDLVGPVFEGHPDLRRIMMPEDWEGHPIHRDYAIDTPHKPWR